MASIGQYIENANLTQIDHIRTVSLYDLEKRALDIIVALPVLIISLPVLILAALAIRLDSPGPVLFRRTVVGRERIPFDALKLRTMCDGAENAAHDDPSAQEEMEANHKVRNDERVTKIGKLLRKTSVDEIPQLFNVLLGQMSLVGPRMISFPEIEKFGIWQDSILSVKPGITGLWQVSGRSNLSYEDRVRLNVYYVKRRGIMLDLRILARTVPAVLTGRGAY